MHLDAFDTKIFYVNTWEMYYKIISLIFLYADHLEIYKSHRVVKLFLESNICLKLFLWWMKKYFIAYFILYIYIHRHIYIFHFTLFIFLCRYIWYKTSYIEQVFYSLIFLFFI